MTVKLVINAISTRPGGGLTVLLGILNGLSENPKIELHATVLCSSRDVYNTIKDQGIAKNVELYCENAGLLKRQWWMVTKLKKVVQKLDADIFLSINQYIRRIACPQVVYHINLLRFLPIDPRWTPNSAKGVTLKQRLIENLRNRSAKMALHYADANVFESNYIWKCAKGVFESGNPLDQVIYIGLPDELFGADTNLRQHEVKPNQIISITNTHPHKDNATLIKTLAELVRQRPEVDWQLKIAGGVDGKLWEPHRKLSEKLGVADRITWLGFVDQKMMTGHLQESLCLVSTSLVESFCMVALESMARGCPTVVADCTSMPESVGNAGALAEAGSAESFATEILKYHDDEKYRSERVELGFKLIRQFLWKTCGEKFGDLFLQIKASDG